MKQHGMPSSSSWRSASCLPHEHSKWADCGCFRSQLANDDRLPKKKEDTQMYKWCQQQRETYRQARSDRVMCLTPSQIEVRVGAAVRDSADWCGAGSGSRRQASTSPPAQDPATENWERASAHPQQDIDQWNCSEAQWSQRPISPVSIHDSQLEKWAESTCTNSILCFDTWAFHSLIFLIALFHQVYRATQPTQHIHDCTIHKNYVVDVCVSRVLSIDKSIVVMPSIISWRFAIWSDSISPLERCISQKHN